MKIQEIISKQFGAPVQVLQNPLVTQVETTITRLVKNNPNRVGLTIINLGGYPIYLTPTPDPATTKGIYLNSNGGALALNVNEDLILPSYEWYAIAATASACYVIEVVLLEAAK